MTVQLLLREIFKIDYTSNLKYIIMNMLPKLIGSGHVFQELAIFFNDFPEEAPEQQSNKPKLSFASMVNSKTLPKFSNT